MLLAATAVLAVAVGVGAFALTRDDAPVSEPPVTESPVAAPSATGSPASAPVSPPSGVPSASASSANSPLPSPSASSTRAPSPSLFVDPSGAAAKQVRSYENAGEIENAALVRKIANSSTATWFADSSAGTASRAHSLVTAAAKAGKLPVLTLYNIPYRDCSGQSAGGAAGADEYRSWISAMAGAIEGRDALVVLEPDAVPQAVQGCLDEERKNQRYELLAYAVSTLSENAGTRVYLDAGNPTWITDTALLAGALRQAGVERATGFSLNVANFETTGSNVTYGTALSGRLGGATFVVDTSRNGNGPAEQGPQGNEHWCNPPGRKLGDPPSTRTGNALVDAYLWVKRPGESDGACGNGAPAAGRWWPEYALELAR
ncbi:glycoside hydrolase family 6 protein [Winogradskya consettensis]|uniref:Glucanase n=1 Tax=Winogradskya consettensis TaxID=113560 RepID=A0A919SSV4_9ACTN|nr:glycoside hydrolase family 6 protein [Actinoplanes consettensis]GIM76969.1 glucanase [Actinoplanes consettensis]